MSTSGRSENNKIHSLNPEPNSLSRNCVKTENPMCRGNEESPKRSLSHKCRILCRGNTSTNKRLHKNWFTCYIWSTHVKTWWGTKELQKAQEWTWFRING